MKILVIDDNKIDAERLSKLLTNEFVSVEICLSGKEADSTLMERGNEFSSVYLSWDIQGSHNGQGIVAKHRKRLPNVKMIALSSAWTASTMSIAARLGIKHFINKPLTIHEVLSSIESTNQSIIEGRVEIEKLKAENQKSLQALNTVLEKI